MTDEKKEIMEKIKALCKDATRHNYFNTSGKVLILTMPEFNYLINLIYQIAE